MTKAELEARRLEYEKSIRFVGWDEDCIFSAMNGFDFAAALLQGELDALKQEKEASNIIFFKGDTAGYLSCLKCLDFEQRYEHARMELRSYDQLLDERNAQLQSANARIEKFISVISEITSLPCDSHQYPNCTVCRSIDVVAHADLGTELNNYESQLQSANAKLAVARSAIKDFLDCSGNIDPNDKKIGWLKEALTAMDASEGKG